MYGPGLGDDMDDMLITRALWAVVRTLAFNECDWESLQCFEKRSDSLIYVLKHLSDCWLENKLQEGRELG